MPVSGRHYSLRGKPRRYLGRRISPIVLTGLAIVLILAGGYVLLLTQAPGSVMSVVVKSEIDLNTSDDATDHRDRIQISKINLEVPFFSKGGRELLEKGSWWRFPERGDPQKGGNFILSAHRFTLGNSPGQTKAKSPFYNLNKLREGDAIRIYFKDKWYDYRVTKLYSVTPDAAEIEQPSTTPKLTLYTCSLKGSADGRLVVEAEPIR